MVSAVALSCAASPQSRLAVACKSRNAVITASHSSSIPVIPVSPVWLTSVRYCEVLGYFLTLCAAGHRCRGSRAVNCPPCSSSPPFLKGTALRQVDMQQLCRSYRKGLRQIRDPVHLEPPLPLRGCQQPPRRGHGLGPARGRGHSTSSNGPLATLQDLSGSVLVMDGKRPPRNSRANSSWPAPIARAKV